MGDKITDKAAHSASQTVSDKVSEGNQRARDANKEELKDPAAGAMQDDSLDALRAARGTPKAPAYKQHPKVRVGDGESGAARAAEQGGRGLLGGRGVGLRRKWGVGGHGGG